MENHGRTYASKTMVFKSLNELAQQTFVNCLCEIRSIHLKVFITQGPAPGYPRKIQRIAREISPIEGQNWNSLSAESKQTSSLYSLKKKIQRAEYIFLCFSCIFIFSCI